MLKNIALTGVSGIGKDYIGDILMRHYSYRKLSCVEPLRRCLYKHFSIPFSPDTIDKHLEYNFIFKNGNTIQGLLIKADDYLGEDGKNLMREIMRHRFNISNYHLIPVVITNLRLPGELAYLDDFDIYRVVGDNPIREVQPFDNLLDDYNFKVILNKKPNLPKDILSQFSLNDFDFNREYDVLEEKKNYDEKILEFDDLISQWDEIL